MDWRILVTLISFSVFYHGFTFYIYLLLFILSFFAGLFICVDRVQCDDAYTRQECVSSRGIPTIIKLMENEGVPKPDIALSTSPCVDAVLNEIISNILRDYVNSWYYPLTNDKIFPTELQRLLRTITSNFTQRLNETDWVHFLTKIVPTAVASHIRVHRCACERKDSQVDKVKVFFDCEVDDEKTVCREIICLHRDKEGDYLRGVCEKLLFFILPHEEYRVPAIRYIARELLVNLVLLPTIDLLSDPDFVNRSVAWFAPENSFTSEYFIQSLKMSESTDELEVVTQQVSAFMDKLRGHDTGGDDDALVKAQLSSLDFLHKTCTVRLQEIRDGVVDKPYAAVRNVQPGLPLYDMTFSEMMSSSMAFVSFLDFLTSIEKHTLLQSYLHCMSYRENVEKLYSSQASTPSVDSPDKSVDRFASSLHPSPSSSSVADASVANDLPTTADTASASPARDDNQQVEMIGSSAVIEGLRYGEVTGDKNSSDSAAPQEYQLTADRVHNEDLAVTAEADSVDEQNLEDAQTTTCFVDDVRAFGVLLCNNLLLDLPSSAEPLVQMALRSITKLPECPDPDAFKELEVKLVELLSDSLCFGAFKKSPQYIQLLSELDLLREPQEAHTSSSASCSDTGGLLWTEKSRVESREPPPSTEAAKPSSSFSAFFAGFKTGSGVGSANRTNTAGDGDKRSADGPVYHDSDAVAKQLRSSLNPGNAASAPQTHTYNADIIRSEIMQDSYVMYTIKVTCTATAVVSSTPAGSTAANFNWVNSWQTMRRFSQFAELHSILADLCGRIPNLKLPSKRPFSNTSRDFLVRRRQELDEYLSILCSSDLSVNYPASRSLVVEFLQPGTWERVRGQGRGVSAILNPFKIVGNAMLSVPDTIADGLQRMVTGAPARPAPVTSNPALDLGQHGRSSSVASLHEDPDDLDYVFDPSAPDDSPIGMLFLLVDELFNLNRRNPTTRRGNFVILRKIFQAFSGSRVNRIILAKTAELLEPQQVAEFVAYLRDSIWLPDDCPPQPVERAPEVKLRTRVLCRTMLLGTISELLAPFLGVETTQRGVGCLFNLMQSECFNRRLVHVLLESLISHMFRPHRSHWESLFEQHLCPTRTGRSCRVHVVAP